MDDARPDQHTPVLMNPTRGVADGMEWMAKLKQYIFPFKAKVVNSRYVYRAGLITCGESIWRGISALVDRCYFKLDVAQAVKEAGQRGFLGETILHFTIQCNYLILDVCSPI